MKYLFAVLSLVGLGSLAHAQVIVTDTYYLPSEIVVNPPPTTYVAPIAFSPPVIYSAPVYSQPMAPGYRYTERRGLFRRYESGSGPYGTYESYRGPLRAWSLQRW